MAWGHDLNEIRLNCYLKKTNSIPDELQNEVFNPFLVQEHSGLFIVDVKHM